MDGSLNKTNASDLLSFPPVKNEFPLFFPGGSRCADLMGCAMFASSLSRQTGSGAG